MTDGSLVIAYHGCDITVRDKLVKGSLRALRPSKNHYDWLGSGVYFFQNDWRRAMDFAIAARDKPTALYAAQPIVRPAVVGAVLCVSRWLDLTTRRGLQTYLTAFDSLRDLRATQVRPMPFNRPAHLADRTMLLRSLDCAVLNLIHELREQRGLPPYQAVRAAFYQGDLLVEGTEFRRDTHVQIALREPSCVMGWFLPNEADVAALSDEELKEAELELDDAIRRRRANKPRIRLPA